MDNSSSDDSFFTRVYNFFNPKPIPGYVSGGGGSYAGGGASGGWEISEPAAGPLASDDPTDFNSGPGFDRSGDKKPGVRLFNPLGDYYSYTYQISLYMITPDAYDEFISAGRKNIEQFSGTATYEKGVYLVAQSGGINNSTTTRAKGFDLDFYIDNLKIKSAIAPEATGMSAQTTDVTFDVIEPYGFSFITKLKLAADTLMQYSNTKNIKSLKNPTRQFYILGVRFLGYDSEGRAITSPEDMYERYWDINITEIKFKIDGRAVNYAVSAKSIPVYIAFGTKRGMINKGASVKGETVEELLTGNDPSSGVYGLITKLNEDERNTQGVEDYNNYNIEFLGDAGNQIAQSKIASKADIDKSKMPMGNAKSASDVNPNLEVKAVPNVNSRQLTFKNDTPIIQAIQQIIANSSYLIDTLKEVYTANNQSNPKQDAPDVIKPDTNKRVKWYMITTKAQNPRFDTKRNDFVYDITYVIQEYQIPVVLTTAKTTPYYGPVKRYEYWYTGKNSEVIRYEQILNNTYAINVLDPAGDKKISGDVNIPAVMERRTNVSRLTKNNLGADAQNQIVTQLMDPTSWATAKVEILGDPDLLIQPAIAISGSSQDTPTGNTLDLNPFYGLDGFTVNPNNGRVFIEIDFKEGVDYNTDYGLMEINDQIAMYSYSKAIKQQLKGVSYLVTEIVSSFRGGRFTQELDTKVNPFGGIDPNETEDQRAESNETNQTSATQSRTGVDLTNTSAGGGRGSGYQPGSASTPSDSTTNNSGFKPVAPVSVAKAATPQVVSTTTASGAQVATTETGVVADDDGNLPASYTPII